VSGQCQVDQSPPLCMGIESPVLVVEHLCERTLYEDVPPVEDGDLLAFGVVVNDFCFDLFECVSPAHFLSVHFLDLRLQFCGNHQPSFINSQLILHLEFPYSMGSLMDDISPLLVVLVDEFLGEAFPVVSSPKHMLFVICEDQLLSQVLELTECINLLQTTVVERVLPDHTLKTVANEQTSVVLVLAQKLRPPLPVVCTVGLLLVVSMEQHSC